jgi:8-oxo-dGTP pyrophosphatase MutT (NUDIX family)
MPRPARIRPLAGAFFVSVAGGGRLTAVEDLLAVVQRSLAAKIPVDDGERVALGRIAEALASLAAPFDREADPVHVTGSALVTGPRGVVLLKHRKLGIWVQPGGHLDPGETPWEAARRETEEETGLSVRLVDRSLLHVDVHPAGGHTHLDLRYLVTVVGDDTPRPPVGESQEVAWYSDDEALAVAAPGFAGLLTAWHQARMGSVGRAQTVEHREVADVQGEETSVEHECSGGDQIVGIVDPAV